MVVKPLGIRSEVLGYGAILRFPLELSDSQSRKIIGEFESRNWKSERSGVSAALRKEGEKIELGPGAATVVASGPQLAEIQKLIEEIYRQTLDRALVFQLA